MRCVLIAWLFPVLACAIVVHGAESKAAPAKAQASAGAEPAKASPAAGAQAAKAPSPESVVPKRELKFEPLLDQPPLKMTLRRPEMLKMEYEATLRLEFTFPRSGPGGQGTSAEMAKLSNLPLASAGRLSRDLAALAPENHRPAADVLTLLTKEGNAYVTMANLTQGPPARSESEPGGMPYQEYANQLAVEYRILAPTAEQAKELAAAIVALFDYGHSYAAHVRYVQSARRFQGDLRDAQATLKKSQAELADLQKEIEPLRGFADLSQEALAQFTTQQRLNAVELAGTEARIQACDRLLADRQKLSASRVEQIETVKIAAEIDLVGLAARRAAIEEIVTKGKRFLDLFGKLRNGDELVRALDARVRELDRLVGEYTTAIDQKTAFAQVGPITIHRVQWEPREE